MYTSHQHIVARTWIFTCGICYRPTDTSTPYRGKESRAHDHISSLESHVYAQSHTPYGVQSNGLCFGRVPNSLISVSPTPSSGQLSESVPVCALCPLSPLTDVVKVLQVRILIATPSGTWILLAQPAVRGVLIGRAGHKFDEATRDDLSSVSTDRFKGETKRNETEGSRDQLFTA